MRPDRVDGRRKRSRDGDARRNWSKARGFANLEELSSIISKKPNEARRPSKSTSPVQAEVVHAHSRPRGAQRSGWFSLRRLFAYAIREGLELVRDPIRMGFALLGTAFLMAVFGAGISTDVDNLSFAVLDRDNSHESRDLSRRAARFDAISSKSRRSRMRPISNGACRSGDIKAAIEIPPDFGRDIKKGVPTEVGAWVDGAMPFRAETIRGYLQAAHAQFLSDYAVRNGHAADDTPDDIREARAQ